MKTTKTVKARCEAVGEMKNSHNAKIGEEARFYLDGECVATKHLHKPDEYGLFKVGEEYEIEIEVSPTAASSPTLSVEPEQD